MPRIHRSTALGCIAAALLFLLPAPVPAQTSGEALALVDTVELALKANLGIKRSQEEINAAEAVRHSSMTKFLPTLGSSYNYIHRNEPRTSPSLLSGKDIVTSPEDQYTFTTTFTQPIFTGFGLINEYKLTELGLDRAEVSSKLTRQDVILDAKNAY
ncbi:MAG: TolC family protein, partial [Nitrospirae bacterium]|nr:TolC family protein [Nitrospirota bacterium]